MPRKHRLPPPIVSHLEVLHAYTSPPIPEKGGLPTIIVTPECPVSPHDFQIHFYSPKPQQESFQLVPSVKSFFKRASTFSPLRSPTFREFEQNEKSVTAKGRPAWTHTPSHTPTEPQYVYSPLAQDDGPDSPTATDEFIPATWMEDSATPKHTSRGNALLTRKLRTAIIIAVPVTLVMLHVLTNNFGFMGFGGGQDELGSESGGNTWSNWPLWGEDGEMVMPGSNSGL